MFSFNCFKSYRRIIQTFENDLEDIHFYFYLYDKKVFLSNIFPISNFQLILKIFQRLKKFVKVIKIDGHILKSLTAQRYVCSKNYVEHFPTIFQIKIYYRKKKESLMNILNNRFLQIMRVRK